MIPLSIVCSTRLTGLHKGSMTEKYPNYQLPVQILCDFRDTQIRNPKSKLISSLDVLFPSFNQGIKSHLMQHAT